MTYDQTKHCCDTRTTAHRGLAYVRCRGSSGRLSGGTCVCHLRGLCCYWKQSCCQGPKVREREGKGGEGEGGEGRGREDPTNHLLHVCAETRGNATRGHSLNRRRTSKHRLPCCMHAGHGLATCCLNHIHVQSACALITIVRQTVPPCSC